MIGLRTAIAFRAWKLYAFTRTGTGGLIIALCACAVLITLAIVR